MTLTDTIKRILRGKQLRDTPAGGIVRMEDHAGRIYDGVPYGLPIVIPAAIRDDAGAVQAFEEAIPDFLRHQFGSPFPTGGPVRMPTINRPLEEWSFDTRQYILEQCHLAWERNPIAKTAVFYTRAFSVQNGASISYTNKDVEAVCEAFIDDEENAMRDLEKATVEGLFVDGEAFFRFFVGDGIEGEASEVKIVPLQPWGITGIRHALGFWKRVEYYRYRLTQDTGDDDVSDFEYIDEEIPASDVLHIAINRMAYERRGRPDMFVMLPWLQAYKEWLENRARQNFWRGALLWWVKLIGATPAQVAAKLAAYRKPMTPGSVVTTNDREEWTQFQSNIGASDAAEDGRQLRAMAAAGARLPEAWLSDGADANLATAEAQALPAITSLAEYQDIMRDKFWMPILKRVIQRAVDTGDLPEMVEVQDADGDPVKNQQPVRAVDAFEVVYSELGQKDPKNTVDAIVAALSADLISLDTARGLAPWQLNAAKEEKQIDAERQKHMDDVAAGLIPSFGFMQQQGEPNGNRDGSEDEQDDGSEDEEEVPAMHRNEVPAA